jgi:hypothetical protein
MSAVCLCPECRFSNSGFTSSPIYFSVNKFSSLQIYGWRNGCELVSLVTGFAVIKGELFRYFLINMLSL